MRNMLGDRARRSRFGNPQTIRRLKTLKNGGGDGLLVCFAEIGGQLFRFTVTKAKDGGTDGRTRAWLAIEQRDSSGFSGGGFGNKGGAF